MRKPIAERFWGNVNKSGPVISEKLGNCWVWTASGQRYGKIRKRGKYVSTHRLSWELANGPIPQGMIVLHKCDNMKCVRPDHLAIGTYQDNVDDRELKGRHPHKTNPPRMAGSKNPSAKLTESQAEEIRKSKERQIDLATRFGVAQTTISKIKRFKNWKPVEATP